MTRDRRGCIHGVLAAVAVLMASLAGTGCADRRTSHLVPVTGLVRQAGRPLERGTVIFLAIPPLEAPLAFGDIAPDGRYAMRSANKYAGVAPGSYAVCIHVEDTAAGRSVVSGGTTDPMLRRRAKPILPPEYASHATTPLRCDVKPGAAAHDIDIPAVAGK